MSTKGKHLSPATRRKISLANRQYTLRSLEKKLNEYLNTNPELPTIQGFLLFAQIDKSTLEKYPPIKEYIKNLQHEKLISRGLSKKNPRFEMFLLKNIHYSTPPSLVQNNYTNVDPHIIAEALKLLNEGKNS